MVGQVFNLRADLESALCGRANRRITNPPHNFEGDPELTHRLQSAAIIAGVVILDRLTKLYVREHVSPWDVIPVIPGFFNIVHTENPGAAFGFLAESNSQWSSVLLIGVSFLVMVVVGVMLFRPGRPGAAVSSLMRVGLALVFGGAVGNLWDRLFRGTVTDFLQFFFGSYEFPSFNAADSAITIGAGLLLLDLWMGRGTNKESGVRTRESA